MNILTSIWHRITGFFSWIVQGVKGRLGLGVEGYNLDPSVDQISASKTHRSKYDVAQSTKEGYVEVLIKKVENLGLILMVETGVPEADDSDRQIQSDNIKRAYSDLNREGKDRVDQKLEEIRLDIGRMPDDAQYREIRAKCPQQVSDIAELLFVLSKEGYSSTNRNNSSI